MQSVQNPSGEPPQIEGAPTMTGGAEAWSQLCAALSARAKLDARIVTLAGRVQRSGTIERIEGLTLDAALSLTHRLPSADRSMLLTAAHVLADMHETRRLFEAEELSWGQVRAVVAEARRLSAEERAALDERIGLSQDMFSKWDPDEAIDQVRIAVEELRDPRAAERSERDRARSNFVWAQPGLFDRGRIHGEFDNCSLAAVINGMDAAAPADDGRPLAQRRADGLVALASHRCTTKPSADCDECAATDAPDNADGDAAGGTDDNPVDPAPADAGSRCTRHPVLRPATPLFVGLIDVKDVSVNAAGMLQLNAPGCIPTISAALLESLAGNAHVRAVLMDGGRPLAVGRKIRAKVLPDDVRFAIKARDRRDRFPGSRRPIEHVHHFDKQRKGHDPDHLAGLSNPSHRRVHRCQWRMTLDPATGEITFRRGERSWTTLPAGTRLRRPPPRDPPAD